MVSEYEQTRLMLVLRYGSLKKASTEYMRMPFEAWTISELKVIGDYVHHRIIEDGENVAR